jgi:nitroreductase
VEIDIMTLSRRFFLASSVLASALLTRGAQAQALPEVMNGFGAVSVRDALSKRESIRTYADRAIDDDQLLALLWAANGVNRPDVDGRTVPSWRTARDTRIFVARASGVDHFDPLENKLSNHSTNDVRASLSPQPFVGKAPVALIYVTELARVLAAAGLETDALDAITEDHRIAAHVNTAVIAQNVYLFCAAEGLGTCLVGGADRVAAAAALNLTDGQMVTYVQPVGHPA